MSLAQFSPVYRWLLAGGVCVLLILAAARFTLPAAADSPETVPADTQHVRCGGDRPAGNCPTLTLSGEVVNGELAVDFSLSRGAKGGRQWWQRLTLEAMCDPDFELRDAGGNVIASSLAEHAVGPERAITGWRADCRYSVSGEFVTPLHRDDASFERTDRNSKAAGTQVAGPVVYRAALRLPENFSGDWTLVASIDPRLDASGNRFTSLVVANPELAGRVPARLPARGVADGSFITTWETTYAGERITIPTHGYGYDYTVNWGDGGPDTDHNGDAVHSYDTAGVYTVSITGDFPQVFVNNGPAAAQIRSVQQWGDQRWRSMAFAFAGVADFEITASDRPNLSGVTDMTGMFKGAAGFSGAGSRIGLWDVSLVTGMNYLFWGASTFNEAIGGWNVSGVETMNGMFRDAVAFNQDVGGWNVSGVRNTCNMFAGATAFNADIGGWNVGSVGNMCYMFHKASSFNQDIGRWDTGSVTNMHSMFYGAKAFNQDIWDWDVAKVRRMSYMFWGAAAFDHNLGGEDQFGEDPDDGWDVSSVTDMQGMFGHALAFNGRIGSWKVSGVRDMSYMFSEASAFDRDVGGWSTSNVTSMAGMFKGAAAFNRNVGNWNTSNVRSMNYMFWDAASFDQDVGGWDVSGVSRMGMMFYGAAAFNQDLGGWDISSVTDMNGMFGRTFSGHVLDSDGSPLGDAHSGLSTANYDAALLGWSTLDSGEMRILRGVVLTALDVEYSAAAALARKALTDTHGWRIRDGGPAAG